MNKLIKRCGRALSGAFLCGSLLFGSAAAEPAMDGMAAFREAVEAPAAQDNRVFRQDLLFFAPAARVDVDMRGYTKGHALRILGDVGLVFANDDGVTNEWTFPFYIDQKQKEMVFYFKPDEKWRKFKMPTFAASAADIAATPDEADNQLILSLVKEVVVLRETDAQRTMLVRLDSNRLADIFVEYGKTNPPDKGTSDDTAWQNAFMECIEKGMRRADIWYTWTVDKKSWKTITMSCNLSSLVQEAARVALETPHEWPPALESYVENIAYYSDMKTYTTFLSPEARKRIEMPNEAKQAVEVEDLIPDDVAAKSEPKKEQPKE